MSPKILQLKYVALPRHQLSQQCFPWFMNSTNVVYVCVCVGGGGGEGGGVILDINSQFHDYKESIDKKEVS